MFRIRLVAFGAGVGFLALAVGVRLLSGGVLSSDNAVQQHSGTALYAALVYAGVIFLRPRTGVLPAALMAAGFCWVVEFAQLTGVPAELSARSVVARLVLGVAFDPLDLVWYLVGVAGVAALDRLIVGRAAAADRPGWV